MNEPTPEPTPQIVRPVPSGGRPSRMPSEPRRPGRSSSLIGGNLRPGMVPGGFSAELSRTSNAGCDERLATRNRKPRQPTRQQISTAAEQFLNRPRPPAETPPPPPTPPLPPTNLP